MRRFYRIALSMGVGGLFLLSLVALGPTRGIRTTPVFARAGGEGPAELFGTRRDVGSELKARSTEPLAPRQAAGRLRVTVYGMSITGTLSPAGAPYTFLLKDGYGNVKAERQGMLGAAGQLVVQLAGDRNNPRGTAILPSDQIIVVVEGGSALATTIPTITARADVESRTVSGTAPPGARLMVAITPRHGCDIDRGGMTPGGPPGDTEPIATVSATTDGGGLFSATFPGEGAWERGTSGQVTYLSPDGDEFVASWASIRLRMSSQQSFLDLVVPPGRVISVTTFSPNGRVAGTGLETIGVKVGNWSCWTVAQLSPSRETGVPSGADIIMPLPGDTVQLDVGEDRFVVKVPDVTGLVDAAANQVIGHAVPGADVTIQAVRPGQGGGGGMGGGPTPLGPPVVVKADATGNFKTTFGGGVQLQSTDLVSLETWVLGSRYTHLVPATIFTVNLNGRSVTGDASPFAGAYAAVQRGGQMLRQTTSRADADGNVVLNLGRITDAGADAFAFQAGDLLTVQVASSAGVLAHTFTIPTLDLTLDSAKGEASGKASSGGRLDVSARMLPNVATTGNAPRPVAVGADGEFRTKLQLPPGTRVDAVYHLAGDHRVQLTRIVPTVHLQHAGSQVCGWADTGDRVDVKLTDAKGKPLASTSAMAGGPAALPIRDDAHIAFAARLVGDNGAPVAVKPGQRVEVTVGSRVITATVPDLFPELNWSAGPMANQGSVEGSFAGTEPGATAFASGPSSNCFGLDDGAAPSGGRGGQAANPYFYTPMPAPGGVFSGSFRFGNPGAGFMFAVASPSGVRFVKPYVRPLSQAMVNTLRLLGRATPHEQVDVQLLDANLSARAWASEMVTNDTGQFELTLTDIAQKPIPLLDGDVVEVASSSRLEQSPLRSIALSATVDADFTGRAPVGQPVTLRLTLRDGRQAPVRLYADRAGRFGFGAEKVPGRVDWRFDDVLGARAVLSTDSQHEVIADASLPDRPYPPLPPPVYLPSARR